MMKIYGSNFTFLCTILGYPNIDFLKKKIIDFFMCICGSLCTTRMQCQRKAEEGVRSPWSYTWLQGDWNLSSLAEQSGS